MASLRRLQASAAMHVLAMLVVVMLPLNGARLAVASIASPGHYHIAKELPALVVHVDHAPHHHSAQGDHTGPLDGDSADILPHASGAHVDHHDHASKRKPLRGMLDNGHQQDLAAEVPHHEAWIGHHGHGLGEAGVVYVESDPERTDAGTAGKHVTGGGEAALPARSMAILPVPGPQLVPSSIGLFVSLEGEPPLRPPSASGPSHA